MAVLQENPKLDQNPWFMLLSETTSIRGSPIGAYQLGDLDW